MYKLMIVDDEYDIRSGLAQYFPWNQVGFEVVRVEDNAKAALDYIRNHAVDAVLTDIEMPQMNGIELAKAIYKENANTKVILLSAHRKFEYAQEAISAQVFFYIIKPTVHSEIQEVFEKVKRELDKNNGNEVECGYYESFLNEAKQIMKENLSCATLISVADKMERSPSFISRVFTEHESISFSDYLLQMRMQKAKILLNSSKYRIYDVGELVGYSNSKNFTRAYKKYYGCTPREYRSSVLPN
ncbi:MAG: response regulator [Eubacteriales bacterium]